METIRIELTTDTLQRSLATLGTCVPKRMEVKRIELLFSGCKPDVFPLDDTPNTIQCYTIKKTVDVLATIEFLVLCH